jgi:hypothetical protein
MARAVKGGGGGIRAIVCGAVVAGLVGGCGADRSGVSSISQGGSGGATPAGAGGAVGMAGAGADPGTGTAGAGGDGTGTGGSGGATGTGGAGGGYVPPAGLVWTVDGGDAASGRASGGGAIHVVARGAVTVGASLTPPPPVSTPPADAIAIDDAALGADVMVAGSIRLDGTLTAGGGDAVRQITSTAGDVFVSGTLRGGEVGGVARGLSVNAPQGTVYVSGTIDTAGRSAGQTGGSIVITGQRVVLMGSLSSNGADGDVGGWGGPIAIAAADLVFIGGPVSLRGGVGTTTAGSGGPITIDASGAVQAVALVDARGGAGSGNTATAGMGGAIKVGELAAPSLVNLSMTLSARGGMGGVAGGKGGAVTLEPQAGNLVIAGSVDLGGGAASAQPGDGGTFLGLAGAGVGDDPVNGGDIQLVGKIAANGGGITAGGAGNGGGAGTVTIEPVSLLGALVIDATGSVLLDGGASGGAGIAGGGGHLYFTTSDGDLTMRGTLSLRGGDARDPGGTGGLGGAVDIFSDHNYDGIGGHLLIATTGLIDASGGAGTIGGSARNDGGGGVAGFPDEMELIAVLINCDGKHGTTENWLDNQGLIVARGGAANGNGGDIVYHGISPDRDSSPPSGNIDNAGNGSGRPGDFGGE